MDQPLFREEAIDHQRERLYGELILTQPVSFTLMTGLFVLITVCALSFLLMNSYTKKEWVACFIVPDLGMVSFYSPQQGILTQINVVEGMNVGEDAIPIPRPHSHAIQQDDDLFFSLAEILPIDLTRAVFDSNITGLVRHNGWFFRHSPLQACLKNQWLRFLARSSRAQANTASDYRTHPRTKCIAAPEGVDIVHPSRAML